MKILSVAKKIPSQEITNDDILRMISKHSTNISPRSLKTYQRLVSNLLEKSGSKTRFVRDRRREESARDLIKAAMSLHHRILPGLRGTLRARPEVAEFALPDGSAYWLRDDTEGPRRAGVNSSSSS